jgi:hypothetical protein
MRNETNKYIVSCLIDAIFYLANQEPTFRKRLENREKGKQEII